MDWLEITINTKSDEIERLCDKLDELGIGGVIIEDESEYAAFLENNRRYWDYVDDELLESWKGLSRVKFYLEDSPGGRAELERIRRELPDETLLSAHVRDEDWENNWKEFYKPVEVGKKLIIVPQWEEAPESRGRTALRLDPGLIFGTGTHPTTKMCLEALESTVKGGERVLDLGCGSGILAIAALLLGAGSVKGCDIDPKAPDIAMENAALNGIYGDRFEALYGDILSDSALQENFGKEKYDIITANIVADVIIAACRQAFSWLAPDGTFICSGIIGARADEVKTALLTCGFTVERELEDSDWYCYVCTKGYAAQ